MFKDNEKSWLQDHEIEIYSAHNEGKSLDGERFIRASMKKKYKYDLNTKKCIY